jgi:predicted RNA-binding Zn-ribbon protein involved in translation (DUF1610 family)
LAEPSTLGEAVRRWERWTDTAHRYLLPAASAAGLGLAGAAAFAAPRDVALFAPWALAALGAGALATSFGYSRWRTHQAQLPPPTVRTPVSRPRAIVRPHAGPDVEREWSDLVRRSWHTAVPVSSGRFGGSARPSTVPAGEELWSHWEPSLPGSLPVELVGPVPETAWVPTASGKRTPFPAKEPGFIVLGGELLPMPPAGTALPDTPASTLIGSPTTDGISTPGLSPSAPAALAPTPPTDPVTWPTFFGPVDELMTEALHPLPPHLRISPNSGATVPADAVEASFAGFELDPMCSSCSRVLPDPDEWRPCPECGEPVCQSCRSQAVVYYGHTWCASCAVGRAWDHPMVMTEPGRMAGVPGGPAAAYPS